MSLLGRLSRLVDVSALPANPQPPHQLVPYILHFVRQYKGIVALLFITNALAATGMAIAPLFLKRMVDAITHSTIPAQALPALLWPMGEYIALALVLRFLANTAYNALNATAFASTYTHSVRRQLHWYMLQHSLNYFQSDFAGRLANKVFDAGSALRDIVVILIGSLWWVLVSVAVAAITLISANSLLLIPLVVWIAAEAAILYLLIPNVRKQSMAFSDARSLSVGKVVDSYTNIQTVKLFAKQNAEDRGAVEAISHARNLHVATHVAVFKLKTWSDANNIIFMGATLILAIWLWYHGAITAGGVAMVIPLAGMLTNQAGWVSGELTAFFEHLGTTEETMAILIKPHAVMDAPNATPLEVKQGTLAFNHTTFAYHTGAEPVLNDLTLTIPAGQKVGLIGPSGAGKSTLVNLLLRFYDITGGTITIDGQNIAGITQESLRSHIGMVTQDTSLMHRSIRENIAYGKPDATDEEITRAATLAHAHTFIQTLTDKDGNTGYMARVGERGVKLSGGQRQRIAIARLILKNAPILILDEATSALDSEVEHAIQENLATLMSGKTVIAIAHRLSTIAALDRLLVIQGGKIIEDGSHAELLKIKDGVYAKLWARQSGGFLPD